MSPRRLFPNVANRNRANAGSEKGIEGRVYPKEIARRLNTDKEFRRKVCKAISRNFLDFDIALAGENLPSRIENIVEGGKPITPKTNLRIIWKDGTKTNFRTTISDASQIHLQTTNNFIAEFSAQYGCVMPEKVKEALLLFSGSHPRQKEILASISVDYVGDKVRQKVEVNYFNRLTLASMYGYDEEMPLQLLDWFRQNCDKIFLFCFAIGAARNHDDAAEFMWYRTINGFEIYNLKHIAAVIRSAMRSSETRETQIRPNDEWQIGSTIALALHESFPFLI